MSEFNDGAASSSAATYPYTVVASQYTPTTTVAISLRQFEKDAKSQAEREYDADHGPLPDPPAEEDTSMPPADLVRLKKKRKVRSAIVSRRKSAIYLEKLQAELELKDAVNVQMKTRLGVFKDVLRETAARIDALSRAIDAQGNVQKRRRVEPLPSHLPVQSPHHSFPPHQHATPLYPQQQHLQPHHHHHQPQQHPHHGQDTTGHFHQAQHSIAPSTHATATSQGSRPSESSFLLNPFCDDMLSISPHEIEVEALKGVSNGASVNVNEVPSGQSSPVTPRSSGRECMQQVPSMCLGDSMYRGAGGIDGGNGVFR